MDAVIRNIQYHPGSDSVAVLIEHPLGQFFVNVSQTALMQQSGTDQWTDADVLVVASAQLAVERPDIASAITLTMPETPPSVATPTEVLLVGDPVLVIE